MTDDKTRDACPFCARIAAGKYDASWLNGVTFEPLNPVTPGHRLFVTRQHESPHENPFSNWEPSAISDRIEQGLRPNKARGVESVLPLFHAWLRDEPGEVQRQDYNLILNVGPAASQTIEHLHLHYVPRRPGDGLVLPWTGQHAGRSAYLDRYPKEQGR